MTARAVQIVMGLKAMHSRMQLHRDIKPDNILLNHTGEHRAPLNDEWQGLTRQYTRAPSGVVKIGDFGLARQLDDGLSFTFNGTLTYLAPERLANAGYSLPAGARRVPTCPSARLTARGVDIWAVGLTVLWCALKRLPRLFQAEFWWEAPRPLVCADEGRAP
jgi:serine/threonine protein kinase